MTLEHALIAYASPTLARLKTGSLFTAPRGLSALVGDIRRLNRILLPRGVRLIALRCETQRTLLYLYRIQALQDALTRPAVQLLLSSFGYRRFTVQAALLTLRSRLSGMGGFPHEIGLFLGYPPEDVIGFIRNRGRNCLCSGCWKAYANPAEARRTFARYDKCRAVYARCFADGFPLSRLTVRA